MNKYLDQLKNSYDQRDQITLPSIREFLLMVNIFLVVIIVLALIFTGNEDPDYHFREERGSITAFSAIFLAIASGLAGSAFFLVDKADKAKKTSRGMPE